jgi:hypothetical protein
MSFISDVAEKMTTSAVKLLPLNHIATIQV